MKLVVSTSPVLPSAIPESEMPRTFLLSEAFQARFACFLTLIGQGAMSDLKSAMRFKTDISRRLPTSSIYEYTLYRIDACIAGGS